MAYNSEFHFLVKLKQKFHFLEIVCGGGREEKERKMLGGGI